MSYFENLLKNEVSPQFSRQKIYVIIRMCPSRAFQQMVSGFDIKKMFDYLFPSFGKIFPVLFSELGRQNELAAQKSYKKV
jgi:hypothetical protein